MSSTPHGTDIGSRKNSHIEICLNDQVEYYAPEASGFGSYRYDHDALPELNKVDIDLSVEIFGKRLHAPIVIGAMTGGTDRAQEINRRLAKAASRCGVGFALGSQRILLRQPELTKSFAVKDFAPDLPLLFGNIGAVQLNYGVSAKDVANLVRMVDADAINFHLNPLQESVQPEGDVDFSGLITKLATVVNSLDVPSVLKEVGSGVSQTTALKIKSLPIRGIETAGVGGTSWSKIESLRANGNQKKSGELFARWGISTVESISNCKEHLPHLTIVASGGIRNGIEICKAITLGADVAACALPFLKAAQKSEDAVVDTIEGLKEEIRTTMFVVGAKNIIQLKKSVLRRARDLTAEVWPA